MTSMPCPLPECAASHSSGMSDILEANSLSPDVRLPPLFFDSFEDPLPPIVTIETLV